MSLAQFEQLMTHDVTIVKQKEDYTGSLTDLETFPEKAFVEYTQSRMVSTEGEQIVTKAIIFLKNATNFDETHDTWAIEHNGDRMKVEAVNRIDDPRNGITHHYELGML